jgi:putative membrane protein
LVVVFHTYCWWYMKQLREETTARGHVFFRVFNELPVFVLIAIVVLVVVKPALA